MKCQIVCHLGSGKNDRPELKELLHIEISADRSRFDQDFKMKERQFDQGETWPIKPVSHGKEERVHPKGAVLNLCSGTG